MKRSWGVALLSWLLAAAPLQAQETGQITGLRLVPGPGGAELVVEMTGAQAARWTELTLDNPPRLVLDITGARAALAQSRFDAIDRGGVGSIRTSQFAPGVVRVVVDLDRATSYSVTRGADGLRVRFSGIVGAFAPWSSEQALPARTAAEVRRQQPPRQPRIDVTFTEADIRDVLATFAEFSGRSIIPGAGVTGTVTATIRQQPWDVALESILSAYGFAAQETRNGIIQVDVVENLARRQTQEPLVTRTMRINYVPVQELLATLEPLKSERGRISANPSTNTLILTDAQSVVQDLEQMIRTLDVRTPQVSIEAKIIFVNRTNAEELGIVYDLKDSRGNSLNEVWPSFDPQDPTRSTNDNVVLLGGNSIAALGNANSRVSGPQLETLISLVLGRYTLLTFIEALQSAELSDVQAAPVITTLDNQEAEIRVGERTPIRVVDIGAGGAAGAGGLGVPRATAELVQTGIILRVTPHITADRRILMQIHAERSSAQAVATDIGVNFQEQVGRTRLMVNDGETAVIGGLTVTETFNTRAGIPFLMDLPIVGRLFRTDRQREQKRDLLIMVTPHIIDDRASGRAS